MEKWVIYAFASMVFAGFTSVLAKLGLAGSSGDLGLAIRTCFVFVFVLMFAGAVVPAGHLQAVTLSNVLCLGLSGVTTALSWVSGGANAGLARAGRTRNDRRLAASHLR